mgnify:CR=1 FL=1
MKNKYTVAIPVETSVREFLPKLRLSTFLADKGFDIIFGSYDEVYHLVLKNKFSVVFMNNCDNKTIHNNILNNQINKDSLFIVLENEGFVSPNSDLIINRLHPPFLKKINFYFAWGKKTYDKLLEKKLLNKDQILITGHPMFEESKINLYKAELDTSRYNDFILINTNFGLINEAVKGQYSHIYNKERVKHEKFLLKSFIELTKKLSLTFDNLNFIVRPHPSESDFIYEREFNDYKNIKVIHEGRVIDWIHNAKFVIHNSCTTALEAKLHGVPIISYMPIKNKNFDINMSNNLGYICSNSNDVIDIIKNKKNEKKINFISTLENFNSSFYNKIDDLFNVIKLSNSDFNKINYSIWFLIKKFIHLFFPLILLDKKRKLDYKYRRRKFFFLYSEYLKKSIKKINGNNSNFKIKRISLFPRTFLISKNEKK